MRAGGNFADVLSADPALAACAPHHAVVLRSLHPIMIAAGVRNRSGKPRYGLHALRHFYASWCVNPKDRGGRELPPKVVQELLGHHSIALTMDVYGHLFPRGNDKSELAAASKALLS
jgi:integrase